MSGSRRTDKSGRNSAPAAGRDRRASLFGAFSVLTSFLFVYYGISILTGGEAPRHLAAFAWVTAGYGLVNLGLLSWARNTREGWCVTASLGFAVGYLGIFAVDSYSVGREGSLRLVGLLLVAVMLWCNWFAVRLAVSQGRRRS